jgi:hypothetical protein
MSDEQKRFKVGQEVWGFAGQLTEREVTYTSFYNKEKTKIDAVSEDGKFALVAALPFVIQTDNLYETEADIDEKISSIGGAKVGDLISYSEDVRWKHKIVMGLVTKVNKVSVTAVNPQSGESTTVRTNKYVVVSKKN